MGTSQRGIMASSLLDATKKGEEAKVRELLLSHPDDISRLDQNQASCLHWACMNGHVRVAQLLLDAKASPALSDVHGRTPLHCAVTIELQAQALTHLIVQAASCSLDKPDSDENTAMHLAALEGNADVIESLAAAGAQIDPLNCDSSTPLQLAAVEGHSVAVSKLLSRKANLDMTDTAGNTALHLATGEGHVDVMQVLLDTKANPELRDANNWTPLMLAAASGEGEAAATLRPYADVGAVDAGGRSSLQLAAIEGHLEVVSVLKPQADPAMMSGFVDEGEEDDSDEMDETLLGSQQDVD